MAAISELRLARLEKGLTLDDVHLLTRGLAGPARLSRIERGVCEPTAEEIGALREALGVSADLVLSVPAENAVGGECFSGVSMSAASVATPPLRAVGLADGAAEVEGKVNG